MWWKRSLLVAHSRIRIWPLQKIYSKLRLIGLLGSASSHKDLLLGWSGFFLQISKIFSKIEDELLEEMKRISKLFFLSKPLESKIWNSNFYAHNKRENPPLYFSYHEPYPNFYHMKSSLLVSYTHKRNYKSPFYRHVRWWGEES